MTRKFQKTYSITDVYIEEIELEEDEIQGLTEDEVFALADTLLWQKAINLSDFDIADDIMYNPEEI